MAANPQTPSTTTVGAQTPDNGALDRALAETFPASDPVAMTEPAPRVDPERPMVRPAVETRQGVTGHNVRYVLIYGLIGVIAAFVLVYLAYKT